MAVGIIVDFLWFPIGTADFVHSFFSTICFNLEQKKWGSRFPYVMNQLPWQADNLKKGCILASIAHAIFVAQHPLFSYEQSWDGNNYSVNNGEGTRGTITFIENYCVGAFRDETNASAFKIGYSAFEKAPQEIVKLAQNETLQYLLDNHDGEVKPVVTSVFWGAGPLFCPDEVLEALNADAHIISTQLLESDDASTAWKHYYELNNKQGSLLKNLFYKKITAPSKRIILSQKETEAIGVKSEDGWKECKESFEELNIFFE